MENFTTNDTNSYAHEQEEKLIFKDECYKIYGCIYNVNKNLGAGFLEAVYQEALAIEFKHAKIPFTIQQELEIQYEGIPLKSKYIADFVCYNKLLIEIKSVSKINNQHKAQLMNYLAATGFKLGLLVNFNFFPKAQIIRIVR